MYHTVWQLKGEWYAWSWPHPPPSLHGTWGSNYKLEWFATRLIYSQQQEVTKQSFHLQLLFINFTREKWQFVGMTQYGRKAGSILHRYPEESPSHLSPPAELTPTWSKMAQVVPCFPRTRSSSQLPTSPIPCHTTVSFQTSSTSQWQHTSSSKDVCNQTALTLLCTCAFFPSHYWLSRSLEKQPTNPIPNYILESSYLIERVS